ncbi:MAG: hypothetical protein ACLSDQ_03160, partial [Adlercreutzia equolifaciens]
DFWNGDIDAMLSEQLDGSGVTLEELREKGYIFKERTDGAKPTEPVYQDYETMFASLPQGKVQCVNEWIGDKPNAEDTGTIERLPVYKGAPESLFRTPELAEEYPLVISDVHAYRLCNHSYYHDVPYLRELQPEPWVKITPQLLSSTASRTATGCSSNRRTAPSSWSLAISRPFSRTFS